MSTIKSNSNDRTATSNEETLEGTVINDGNTEIKDTNRVVAFIDRHRSWFMIAGAATAGFILHGFLARPDDCAVDYESDDTDDDIDLNE